MVQRSTGRILVLIEAGVLDLYEKISDELISTERFLWRMFKHGLYVLAILILSVLAGTIGFAAFEGYSLDEAALHSAHILAGLGLIELPETTAGRMFAVFFGLYASLFFIAVFSVIIAPVVHRILHRMHLDDSK